MLKAGIETIDFDRKYAAIKIHFGEPGNLAYLRPNYARTVVDVVKSMPDAFQGPRRYRIRRDTEEYWNGVRLQGWKDGDAQRRKAPCKPETVYWL